MIGFAFISFIIGMGWGICHALPDAVGIPANVIPEVVRFLGVLVELNVAFPVQELFSLFAIWAPISIVMAMWRTVEYLWSMLWSGS